MNSVLIETISAPWVKALSLSKREGFLDPWQVWNAPPDTVNTNTSSGFNARGVWNLGAGGGTTVQRIKVMPYCEGQPGSVFWMRVYGWSPVGTVADDPKYSSWVPNLLGEFLCVAGNIPGPHLIDNVQTLNALLPGENLCDAISLNNGVLGLNGIVNSQFPGSGVPAFAVLEVYGARKVSFDFACDAPLQPELPGIGMNCLWARL